MIAAPEPVDVERCDPRAGSRRSDLTGAVLCGGRSRRMADAGDKALLRLGERTLLQRAADVLAAVGSRVVLACGQTERYAELGLELVLDAELAPGGEEQGATGTHGASRPGLGPLAGLVAALEACETEWLAVLACDMPRAEPAVVEALLLRAEQRELDICLLAGPRGREPLFGVYRRTCARPAREALEAGERRLVAIHSRLSVGTLGEEELAPELRARDCARNLNTPEDLARERSEAPANKRTPL